MNIFQSIFQKVGSGPSPRCRSRGGQKSQGGAHFEIQCWMYAATATKKVTCDM